ncbi:MAG: CBS domain-containing protein [Rubrivivax sp.]
MDTLTRNAGELCQRDVAVAYRFTALDEAARVMRERHVGCLVVVDETAQGRIVCGMLTDRDIVTSVMAKGVNPATVRVGDVMSEDVATARAEDTPQALAALMQRRGVRRVPVVGAGGALLGVISADDLLHALGETLQALASVMGEQRRREAQLRP